jgi:serine/threonine protein kinase
MGSFLEEDVHLSKRGIRINKVPKSPQVDEEMSQSVLQISNKILGQGTSGIVKLAVHIPTQRTVAVKVSFR